MFWNSLNTKSKILTGMMVPLVLLVILGVIAIASITKLSTTSGWVNHTYVVLGRASDIVSSAVDMETGMRGYLLAGKEDFLDPYKGGEKAAYERIEALQETVNDNPGQVARLEEVKTVLREWQANVTEPAIQLRREIGDAETMNDMADLVGQAKGKAFFDKFRGQIATFIEREQKLLEQRENEFSDLLRLSSVDSGIAKQTIGWVTHTYKVIASANDIIAAAVDMETGMRGYLLAGKETFLDPYKSGSEKFFVLTASLRETVNDNPAQMELLTAIDATIKEWQTAVTEPAIALRRKIGDAKNMDDMADLIGEARGKIYFDKFRGLMAEFSAEETQLKDIRIQENVDTERFADILLVGGIIVAIILGSGIGWFIGGGIAGPIQRMTEVMGRLAEGDKSLEIPGVDRTDEVGQMAAAVQVFKDNMIKTDELTAREATDAKARDARSQKIEQLTKDFDSGSAELLSAVTSSAAEMEKTASSMSSIADETSTRASTVTTAAEQASQNVQTVATATEELSSSIHEISRQVTQSSQVTARAVGEADKTDQQVQGLLESANKIGEVIGLISDIAEQTNLLALNATIEAARAGESGKGFAVVASEVKNLANQTAKATEEISAQISGIQAETETAVTAIRSISSTIGEINEISSAIAAAVEEQGAATSEIARNVEETSAVTQEVTSNIVEVTRAAGDAGSAAGQVTEVAKQLNGNSDKLKHQVERFLADVRSS